jgi:hypothetical protein
LYQFIKNKIPIKNVGPEIVRLQDSLIYQAIPARAVNMIYNNPAVIKAIPPTISYFHAIINTAIKINVGTLCNNIPVIICPKLKPGDMTSKENSAIKQIKSIDIILGVQYKNLLIFLAIDSTLLNFLQNLKSPVNKIISLTCF